MTTAPEWTYRHAAQLRNHWWWRPGWHQGTRFYTWHITFDHAEPLHQLVRYWQSELAQTAGLDIVPARWLHLTMQGVGMVSEVPDDRRAAIVAAVRNQLASLPPTGVEFRRPVVRPEAIALPALPVHQVQTMRNAVRAGMADVLGADAVPEPADGYQPHISLAYVNKDQPAATLVDALERCADPEPAAVTLLSASLIELHRDNLMYEWRTIATAPMGRS